PRAPGKLPRRGDRGGGGRREPRVRQAAQGESVRAKRRRRLLDRQSRRWPARGLPQAGRGIALAIRLEGSRAPGSRNGGARRAAVGAVSAGPGRGSPALATMAE